MYLTDELLEKINSKLTNDLNINRQITLPDIMIRSFSELKELAGDSLSWGEKNFLYQQAQEERKKNKLAESCILSRANPQLANAVRLGIRQSSMIAGYNDLFPRRTSSFVKAGAVASMFSPAGYLTELYREAQKLHQDTAQYHLDTRRPDLAALVLSQDNLDDELSTLSLSNELLLSHIQTQENLDYDAVLKMLSTYRLTGMTPYHQPYEATRQAIILQDPQFTAFRRNPDVAAQMDTTSLLGIQGDISPELYKILVEEITEENADELISKNFGENADTSILKNVEYLAHHYNLTKDEILYILNALKDTVVKNLTPGREYYKDNSISSLFFENEKISSTRITRTIISNKGISGDLFKYVEIIPVDEENYHLDFEVIGLTDGASDLLIGTTIYGSDIYSESAEKSGKHLINNTPATIRITLDNEKLLTGTNIFFQYKFKPAAMVLMGEFNFKSEPESIKTYLLKLNKIIRLYKATDISPSTIHTVTDSINNDLTIDSEVLSQLFWVNHYMQHYGITADASQILSGALVSQIFYGGISSAFDQLFNQPPLNNQIFNADSTVIKLKPSDINDTFRSAVLKRAFQVNDTELYTLWLLATGETTPPNFTCDIQNLSAVYRVSLLAQIHALSVTELAALLSVSPYAEVAIGSLSGQELAELIGFLKQYTEWLAQMNWSVSDIYLMLTDRYSTTMTPEIENLVTTLQNGLANQDLSRADEAGYIRAVAPFIAAAAQLDSAELAAAILQWLDQIKPNELTLEDFLALVDKESRDQAETVNLVVFCQVLGQLAFFVRKSALSATELSWILDNPARRVNEDTVLSRDIVTLRDLTALHSLLLRCGPHATEVLTSLSGKSTSSKNNLAIATLATALGLDEQALTQALKQVSSYAYFYNWHHLRIALEWMDAATLLGVTPDTLATLIKMKYTDTASEPKYEDWAAVSHALQAGLNRQKTAQLQGVLDEKLSAATSAYVIKNSAPLWVTDRDKLYSWLLIDNQISAQVKTTRLAEAIASVQLYVNRALTGQEDGVVDSVKSRQFFTADWDTYNKRYSTWSGVSQLVYYPENYVDPTLRIGQTNAMDNLLQQISQSQVNTDTVEDGIKNYLTAFDEVANLESVNAYHDHLDTDAGFTWFIGCSQTDPKKYYWRKVDHSKFSEGKFAANAWSEWVSIESALFPVGNNVRPVTFGSRLYVAWIEEKKYRSSETSSSEVTEYYLKLSHIRYDGTWISPYSVKLKISDMSGMRFYIGESKLNDSLVTLIYKEKNSYNGTITDTIGLYFFPDGKFIDMDSEAVGHYGAEVLPYLETPGDIKACNLIAPEISAEYNIDESDAETEYYYLSTRLDDLTTSYNTKDEIVINILPTFTLSPLSLNNIKNDELLLLNSIFEMNARYLMGPFSVKKDATGRNPTVYYTVMYSQSTEKTRYFAFLVDKESISSAMFDDGDEIPISLITKTSKGDIVELHLDDIIDHHSDEDIISFSNDKKELIIQASLDEKNSDALFVAQPPSSISITASGGNPAGITPEKLNGDDYIFGMPEPGSNGITVRFTEASLTLTKDLQWQTTGDISTAQVTLTVEMKAVDISKTPGNNIITITLRKKTKSSNDFLSIHKTDDGAQYLQAKVYRTRLNTLFARQLIDRANAGIDAVLTMDTQNIQEPMLGQGTYVTLELTSYDQL